MEQLQPPGGARRGRPLSGRLPRCLHQGENLKFTFSPCLWSKTRTRRGSDYSLALTQSDLGDVCVLSPVSVNGICVAMFYLWRWRQNLCCVNSDLQPPSHNWSAGNRVDNNELHKLYCRPVEDVNYNYCFRSLWHLSPLPPNGWLQ